MIYHVETTVHVSEDELKNLDWMVKANSDNFPWPLRLTAEFTYRGCVENFEMGLRADGVYDWRCIRHAGGQLTWFDRFQVDSLPREWGSKPADEHVEPDRYKVVAYAVSLGLIQLDQLPEWFINATAGHVQAKAV